MHGYGQLWLLCGVTQLFSCLRATTTSRWLEKVPTICLARIRDSIKLLVQSTLRDHHRCRAFIRAPASYATSAVLWWPGCLQVCLALFDGRSVTTLFSLAQSLHKYPQSTSALSHARSRGSPRRPGWHKGKRHLTWALHTDHLTFSLVESVALVVRRIGVGEPSTHLPRSIVFASCKRDQATHKAGSQLARHIDGVHARHKRIEPEPRLSPDRFLRTLALPDLTSQTTQT